MVEPRFIRWIKVHLFGIHSPSLYSEKVYRNHKERQDMKIFTIEQIDQMLELVAKCQVACILGKMESGRCLGLSTEFLGEIAYRLNGEEGLDKVLSRSDEIMKTPLGKDTNHD